MIFVVHLRDLRGCREVILAKTFEALMKAEKESQMREGEVKVLKINPRSKPHMPVSFKAHPQIVEEYQRMRQTLLSANTSEKIKTLLFVSPTQGEGTSTVLTNFAITLATGGDMVLVVDANHRNPSLHNTLNVEKKGGLTELLHDKYHTRAVIKKTQIKNLSVITSGIPLSNPFSIFDSIAVDNLITQMKLQADWVLFDSPPINVYNDASALAAKMDGVVMVVQAENTRWEVAQSAKKKIKNAKVSLLGVILNRRKMHIPDWAYRLL